MPARLTVLREVSRSMRWRKKSLRREEGEKGKARVL